MRVTVLGCGTSGGVPRIDGHWGACDPHNARNRRRRVSILVEDGAGRLLVDTSPDLRLQCLDAGITGLDAVFYTHDHADHTAGIDDLRGLVWRMGRRVPVYGSAETLATLRRRFGYVFEQVGDYPPICEARELNGALTIAGIAVQPFAQEHGDLTSWGYRFGKVAYSTDLNGLPDDSAALLEGLDLWIVDALRYEPHPTHFHLAATLEWIARLKPKRAILTHMTWDMDYDTLREQLPEDVTPAYDGMVLEV